MPEYDYLTEKYKLFYALYLYYILNKKYAEAFHFAKLANEGVEYLPKKYAAPEIKKMLIDFINNMEGAFRGPEIQETANDNFNQQMLEAIRLYKAGNFSDCCALLDELGREVQED